MVCGYGVEDLADLLGEGFDVPLDPWLRPYPAHIINYACILWPFLQFNKSAICQFAHIQNWRNAR